ncbi:hypothetical protein H2200_000079 [Cladophialophora chaetospira]|uniref:C2H2-type domain-containing protein n=1 Tax=Cladophialophora chaetospira TaxID=386627 RepID=A0AA39CQM3_9EURO|nr:hypothetical protein H2200_000079 [Cladophialophora chaetospira]
MRTWSLMMLNSSSSDGGIGYQQVCSICHESMPEKFSSLPNLELPQQQPRAVLNVSQDVPKSTVPVPAKPQDNLDTSGPDTEQMLNTVQSSAGGDFGFNADAALAVSSSLWHHGTAITLQEITSKDSFYSSPADLIAVQALQQAATRRDSTGETKTYVCPEVSCLRVFVRKSYYDSHLKSKHAGIPINADKTLSGQPSPRPDTRDPSPKPEGRVPVRERTPTILPTPKITEIASFRNVTDSPSTKQKTETVSEWLEDVQTNGIPATPTLRSATCPDSQQSVASGLTPQSMSLCKSYSTASAAATDSPCFESEGEAYFVLGDDVTTSATPYEPDWPTLSPTVLAQELVTRYFAHKSTPADTPAEGVESSSQASSASSTSGQTHTTANPSSVTTPPSSAIKSVGKRSLEDDEGDGSRRHKRPRLSDGSSTNAGEKLLACPYAKFDPRRYSEQNESEKHYRGCSSCYLRDIARLKQHLYRVHRRPEHHCPTCFTSFDSTVLLHAHIVARTCQQRTSPFEEKMTPDQVTAIRRRGMGRSRSESWNEIYKILFPDSPLPLNPYIESVHAETLQDFMAYVERDGQQALVSEINQRMFGSVQASSEEEQQFVERVISESVGVLLQRLDARFRRESSES